MKARIKGTDEIVDVKFSLHPNVEVSTAYWCSEDTKESYHERELIFLDEITPQRTGTPIDWEQRRYELAKEAMGAFIASASYQFCANNNYYEAHIATAEYIAKDAVNYADALIAELRKPNPDDEFSSIVEQAPNLFKALKEIAETDTNLDILGWSGKIKTIARDAINRCKKGGKE